MFFNITTRLFDLKEIFTPKKWLKTSKTTSGTREDKHCATIWFYLVHRRCEICPGWVWRLRVPHLVAVRDHPLWVLQYPYSAKLELYETCYHRDGRKRYIVRLLGSMDLSIGSRTSCAHCWKWEQPENKSKVTIQNENIFMTDNGQADRNQGAGLSAALPVKC